MYIVINKIWSEVEIKCALVTIIATDVEDILPLISGIPIYSCIVPIISSKVNISIYNNCYVKIPSKVDLTL